MVQAITDRNAANSGGQCFSQIFEEQVTGVEAIVMDMNAAFLKSVKINKSRWLS